MWQPKIKHGKRYWLDLALCCFTECHNSYFYATSLLKFSPIITKEIYCLHGDCVILEYDAFARFSVTVQAAILEPLGYHAHRNCVSVDAYMNNGKLKDFFKILSTNEDSNGRGFVSTVEGKTF